MKKNQHRNSQIKQINKLLYSLSQSRPVHLNLDLNFKRLQNDLFRGKKTFENKLQHVENIVARRSESDKKNKCIFENMDFSYIKLHHSQTSSYDILMKNLQKNWYNCEKSKTKI